MPQTVNLKVKGLYTAPNSFSGVPEGALVVADDIVINQENLAESRRGFDSLGSAFSLTSDRANRYTVYQTKLVAHYGSDSLAYYSAGWNVYSGSYSHPDSTLARSRFQEINQNLYFSTSTGIKKLDTYNGTPVSAGVPKGLDLQVSLSGSSGFLTTNSVVEVTGTTANTSPTLSVLSSVSSLAVGQYISGTGITAGTKISALTASATVLSTTCNTTAGNTTITTLAVTTGIAANQLVTGSGIPSGTRVVSVNAGAFTAVLTAAPTATATGAAIVFSSDPTVTMDANATATGSAVSLTFSSGSQISYRILFGIRDANNNLLYGAPSQIATVTNNTGATRDVSVNFTIPSGITTSHFYQIYRSNQTATAAITPLDDMQQVYEGNPTSGEISAGTITVTDNVPDSLRGQFLYTSTSQDGISQSNEPPPYCKDFCHFRGYTIYANTKSKHRRKLTVLAVGSPNGVQSGDTLTVSGVVFTAAGSETIGTGTFKVYTAGTPAQNIADTVNSLIRVVNRYTSNTATYAYLLSGPTDLPGQILFEERSVGGSAFAVTASARGAAYSPTLPTAGTTVISSQDIYKNGLMISKSGQPEAVPLVNLLYAGSASQEILRVIPLREYVIVLKTDGVYKLNGTTLSTFQVVPFDLTTKVLAPDSAVSLSNEVWAIADQGVVSISDTGVNVRSRAIEDVITTLLGTAISEVKQYSSAVAYETDKKYILAIPSASGDTFNQNAYVFNTFTNTWVRWTRKFSTAFIHPTEDKLYLGNADDANTAVERKTGTFADYIDEGTAVTISSSSDLSVVLTSVSGISVGDLLYQDSTHRSVITAITSLTNTVTVQDEITWSNGAATVYAAIGCVMQWQPLSAGNPGHSRQCSEGVVIFKSTRFNSATVSFYTDVSQSFEDVSLTGFALGTWGTFPWGSIPWGGVNRPRSIRFYVPQDKQFCSQLNAKLTVQNAYSSWKCEGLALTFFDISEEVPSP